MVFFKNTFDVFLTVNGVEVFKTILLKMVWILQVDCRDWALNGNTISLDEETVIDIPQPFDQMEKYCASLGHKANHSFTPNCRYEP